MCDKRIYITFLVSLFLHFGLIYIFSDLNIFPATSLPSEISNKVTKISFYNNIEVKPDMNNREGLSSSPSPVMESLPVIYEEKEGFIEIKEPKKIFIKKEDPLIFEQKITREQFEKLEGKEVKRDIQLQNSQNNGETTKKIESKQIQKEISDIDNKNTAEKILLNKSKEEGIYQKEIQENKPEVLSNKDNLTKEQEITQLVVESELPPNKIMQAGETFSSTNSDLKKNPNKGNEFLEILEVEEGPLDFTEEFFDRKNAIPPGIVIYVPPVYPEKLRKREIEGRVQLKVLISNEGQSIQIQIANSSGYHSFDQAAVESVKKWRFSPARIGEKNRESWVIVPVTFRLK